MILLSFINKEFLLIRRDLHALLVLFVMPTLFILIMSFALKNSFSGEVESKYQVALIAESSIADFDSVTFDLVQIAPSKNQKQVAHKLLYDAHYDFVLTVPKNTDTPNTQLDIQVKSSISPRYVAMLKAEVALALQTEMLTTMAEKIGVDAGSVAFSENYVSKGGKQETITSVDQSVPSWLIFSMFFILIPISNTFMNERSFGTFDRLKSMNVSPWTVLLGKFVPYLLVNQIQVLIMFAIGLFAMPLLGLSALQVRGGFALLFLVALFTSFAAIAFGLLIANIAKTSEEATTLGGVSNIIFAAIGGIMVPTFVMPEVMQKVAEFSPMAWSLQSFLEIIVSDGGWGDIRFNLLKLFIFALACLSAAYQLLKTKEAAR